MKKFELNIGVEYCYLVINTVTELKVARLTVSRALVSMVQGNGRSVDPYCCIVQGEGDNS